MNIAVNRSGSKWVDFASAGNGTPGGTFLRKFWQPVYQSSQLPRARAVPIHIMGEKFTLYRGESGAASVVGFACAHRNTQLSTGWVKGDAIQCLYHGWTYDGSGACTSRPGENPPGPCADVKIPAYPTREHLGLIYAYFGAGEAPAFPPFPAFEGGVIENSVDLFPCNWFQTYENQIDEVHVAFVHSPGGSHNALGRGIDLPDTVAEETAFGMVRHTSAKKGPVRDTLYIFPNTMRIIIPAMSGMGELGGWRDTYITLVPTDDENHLLFITQHAQITDAQMEEYLEIKARFEKKVAESRPPHLVAQDILDGKYTLADVLEHPKLLVIEDAVAQSGQGRIADRGIEHLGRTDVGIVRMRRVFDRELRAIIGGKPLKDWRYSGEPPARGF